MSVEKRGGEGRGEEGDLLSSIPLHLLRPLLALFYSLLPSLFYKSLSICNVHVGLIIEVSINFIGSHIHGTCTHTHTHTRTRTQAHTHTSQMANYN